MITELLDKLPALGILVFSMFVTFLALEFGFHLARISPLAGAAQ